MDGSSLPQPGLATGGQELVPNRRRVSIGLFLSPGNLPGLLDQGKLHRNRSVPGGRVHRTGDAGASVEDVEDPISRTRDRVHCQQMIPTQKPTAPVASSNAKPNQPARTTPPVNAAHPTPASGGPDSTCFVHCLEHALQLVESMKLTDEQKTEISQLTEAQSARCAEAKEQHRANHEQILALLTPDQQQTLKNAADAAEHCHQGGHGAHVEHPVHA